jgi:hypothetical protein
MNPFGIFYSFQFVLMVACAFFYYKAGEIDNAPSMLWAGISVVIYLLTWLWLGWGLVLNFLAQLVLLIAIAVVRFLWEQRGE